VVMTLHQGLIHDSITPSSKEWADFSTPVL
jgi:hypothetical protein